MTKLVALDCESTSLRRDCRIWEIGVIERLPGGDVEHRWFIRVEDLNMGDADPFSLDIGKFYQRHPQMNGAGGAAAQAEQDVLRHVERVCRGAHIIGNVVNFDTQRLDARMAACGILWNAHYHVIDCENLAVGWLLREAAALQAAHHLTEAEAELLRDIARPPWDSGALSQALGVKVPEEDRHTALGEARWALAMFNKVMGSG